MGFTATAEPGEDIQVFAAGGVLEFSISPNMLGTHICSSKPP